MLTTFGHPLFVAFAWILAAIYAAIPNYAIAIAMFTVLVMVVVFSITLRGTRQMMRTQLLAPELKEIQNRHRIRPGMSPDERRRARQALNEEMLSVYREHNASPTGGCLPLLVQLPVFLVLYQTVRGLTHLTSAGQSAPLYLSHTSRLYESIRSAGGNLHSFGINLADSVRSVGLTWPGRLPYLALVLVAVALGLLQMRQLSGRHPTAQQANPKLARIQRWFPVAYGLIYLSVPAAVNLYFLVSSLFRLAQQELMYRRDPRLHRTLAELRASLNP